MAEYFIRVDELGRIISLGGKTTKKGFKKHMEALKRKKVI